MSIGKLLATALTVLSLSAPAMAAQQVVINGSTTVLPVVQKAGEAFMASHPDVELSISGGGSGKGKSASGAGAVIIAASPNMPSNSSLTPNRVCKISCTRFLCVSLWQICSICKASRSG